jgi:sulfite oxidase
VDVTTVIQCNGNRREDFHYADGVTPAFGPPHWVAGAIGNATWSGPRMRDVMRAAGMDVDAISLGKKDAPKKATQVGLLGMDHDEVGNQYCCSFPFDKAVDPFGDCILAFEMNGEPIPRSHGYPVRAIVPGHAGARNCKYLERITVTDTPCCDFCNWKQYAVHAPDVPMHKIANFEQHSKELKQDPAVQEMPVQSMITNPSAGDILCAAKNGAKSVYVKGIAWGGGGQGINRVDVSLDNGTTFTRAEVLDKPVEQRRRGQWSWVFFEKHIPIPEDMQKDILAGKVKDVVLTSKALNTAWNVQPENPTPNWNSHGCCVNHWYRVPITLSPTIELRMPDGDFGNKPSGGRFVRPFRNLDQPSEARARARENKKKALLGCETSDCTCGNGCVCGTGCQSSCYKHDTRL